MPDTAEAGRQADHGGGPWRLPAVARSVSELRHRGRDFAVRAGADEAVAATIALAISEACTNAVMHAFVGREPGVLTLRCETGPGELRFQVTDDGVGVQARNDSPGMGMGLAAIARMATRLDVRAGADRTGTEVDLVFRAPGVLGPGPDPPGAAADLLVAAGDLARGPVVWPQDGFERLCTLALPAFADASTVDVADHGTLRRLAGVVHGDADLSDRLAGIAPPLKPGTATWSALRGGGPQLVMHDAALPRTPGGPGALLGLAWWLAVPVTDPSGAVLALWGLGGRGTRPAPGAATITLLEQAALRAAGTLAGPAALTATQETRRRLDTILSAVGDAVTVSTPGGVLVYANDAAARLHGEEDAAALLARDPGPWTARHRVTMAGDAAPPPAGSAAPGPPRGEDRAPLVSRSVDRRTGHTRWLRTTGRTLTDRDGPLLLDVVQDVTEAVRADQRARVLDAAARLLDDPAAAGAEPAVTRVTALLVPAIADGCVLDVAPGDGRPGRRVVAGPPGLGTLAAPPVTVTVVTDAALGLLATDAAALAALQALRLRSLLVVPLRVAGRDLGSLALAQDEGSGRELDAADAAFAADLGRRLAAALALGAPGQPVA